MFKILATTAALSLAAFSASAAVVNGSFELDPGTLGINNDNTFASMPGASGNDSWDIFESVPGWTTEAGDGVELQTRNTIPLAPAAGAGDYYAELDGNQNSSISQMVELTVGRYTLSFLYSPRVQNNAPTNEISYGLDGIFGLSVTGPSGTVPFGVWTVVTQEFTITTAGAYSLYFDASGSSNSFGGFIDDIAIAAVPVPAGGLLLIGAIGGLAALRRRKALAA